MAYSFVFTEPKKPQPGFLPRAVSEFIDTVKWPSDSDPEFKRALKAFTVSNAVPFVGALTLDKEVKSIVLCGNQPTASQQAQSAQTATVLSAQASPSTPAAQTQPPSPPITQSCSPVPRFGFQLLVLAQSILSALCFFFIALALRNYFKLK